MIVFTALFFTAADASSAALATVVRCEALFVSAGTPVLESKFLDAQYANALMETSHLAIQQSGIVPLDGIGAPGIWKVDGIPGKFDSYESSFADILKMLGNRKTEGFFEKQLQLRKRRGQRNHVLDLFGSGTFIRKVQDADSITGFRFESLDWARAGVQKRMVPTEVLGDIINPNTWKQLDASMSNRSIPKFDLVTMRPDGGWFRTPWFDSQQQSLEVLKYIIGNVLLRLSTSGHYYFDVDWPNERPKREIRIAQLQLVREIEQNTNHKLILFEKIEVGQIVGLSGALVPK